MVDRCKKWPANEEATGEQFIFEIIGFGLCCQTGCLDRAQVQQLTSVVPLVERLGYIDPLVALQANQLCAGSGCNDLSYLGLAYTSVAFEQQWSIKF